MKKIKLLTLLFTALLVSGSVWGEVLAPVDSKSDNLRPALRERPVRKIYQNAVSRMAVAETMVAEVNGVQYASVEKAFAAVPKDGTETTVTLLCSTQSTYLLVDSGRNIVFDLNGKTITFDEDAYIGVSISYTVGYESTPDDKLKMFNGTIVTTSNGIFNYGTLILTNVTITAGQYSVQNLGGIATINSGNYGYIYNTGTGEINGGTFSKYLQSSGELVINNGTFNSYIDNYGELTINNGTFNGVLYTNEADDVYNITGGVFNKAPQSYGGVWTISGGTFNSTAWYTFYASAGTLNISGSPIINNTNTTTTYGSCIYASAASVSINISGGEFIAPVYMVYASWSKPATINISGGTFNKGQGKYFNYGTYNITGGWFDSNDLSDYGTNLALGCSFGKPSGGYYPVIKAVAQMGGYGYASVSAAAADAQAGDVVTLIDNDSQNEVCNKSIILDMKTFSINGKLSVDNANIKIYGADQSSISELEETNGGNIDLYAGTYDSIHKPFIANGYKPRYNNDSTKFTVGRYVAIIVTGHDTAFYWTLPEAFAQADKKVVQLQHDNYISSAIIINSGKNITLDLNGKVVSYSPYTTSASVMFNNSGVFTVRDSKDTLANGEGGGKITTASCGVDQKYSPSYASNLINNNDKAVVNIESGWLENTGSGGACFVVDCYNSDTLNVKGGKLTAIAMAIRNFGANAIVNITGGYVGSVWIQDCGDTIVHGALNVDNATILYNVLIGGAGSKNAKGFTVNFNKANVGVEFICQLNSFAHYIMDSVHIESYDSKVKFINPDSTSTQKHLINGQFRFYEDVYTDYITRSQIDEYPENQGYYMVPRPEDPNYFDVYRYAEAFLREFNKYIVDGYGLVALEPLEDKWYEIRPLKGQSPDPITGDTLTSPWHQGPTWEVEGTKEIVPTQQDAVVIDHNVYVEGTKDVPEGQQPEIANAGSIIIEPNKTLTVRSGAVLNVGNAGIIIKKDTIGGESVFGKLVIEPQAIVTVGDNGVIADSVQNILIQAAGQEQGVFLLNPEVTMNTTPSATVEMVAEVGKDANNDYRWHRFAIPVDSLTEPWRKDPNYSTYLYEWSYADKNWTKTKGGSTSTKPFMGYTITINEPVDSVTYTFVGNLLGNNPSQIDFKALGYGYFGNSYTGHMLAKVLLEDVMQLDEDSVAGTVWMWNPYQQKYTGVSLADYKGSAAEDLEDYEKEVAPMQTFILKLLGGGGTDINIDYADAIWSNPRYGLVKAESSAPARFADNGDDAYAKFVVTSSTGQSDLVRMTENSNYTDAYENGADAQKYINTNSMNLYTSVEDENYTSLYTDNLEGKTLTLQTTNDVNYTLTIGHVVGSNYALQDLLTNKIIPMNEGETYEFVAQPNKTEERFMVIKSYTTPTNVRDVVCAPSAKGIYTVLGQYLGETENWNTLPSGVYVVDGVKLVK